VFDGSRQRTNISVKQTYTRRKKTGHPGGSNGVCSWAAMITQHPDLRRAVVSQVGIYDIDAASRSDGEFIRHRVRHGEKPRTVQSAYALLALCTTSSTHEISRHS